jgi:thioredoxin-dependent peroxiredoxin
MVLTINNKAPKFTLPNQDGKGVKLADFKDKFVVLYFYPKDNTPGCTIEAIDFSKLKKEFTKNHAIVLGVSPDPPTKHCNFIKKKDLTITLLSDEEKVVMNQYGVWGLKKFMGREFMGVIRSTFLIKNNKILKVWSPVKVKGHAQEVLDEVNGK